MGSFIVEERKNFRYVLIWGYWHGKALGSLTTSGGILCGYLGLYIWLSVVGPKLEPGRKIRGGNWGLLLKS